MKTARILFELQEIKESGGLPDPGQDKRFIGYMEKRLTKMKNPELKAAIESVMKVADLKQIDLSQDNIQFLGRRALEVK